MSAAPSHGYEIDPRALEILLSPRLWGETYLVDRDLSKRRFWDHQVEDLECPDPRIIHQDGRDVGKSIDISGLGLHFCFTNKGKEVLVTAPLQGHLDNIVEEIEWQIDHVPEINASVARKRGGRSLDIKRAPYYRLRWANGCLLHLVPAGHDGSALRSYHVDFLIVDEAARLTNKAWKAVDGCLKSGGRLRAYSNPDGRRDTPYYRYTNSKDWTVFKWPSWLNPNWNEETARRKEELHGGRNTEGWVHEVAGEHGSPAYAAFNLDHFYRCQREKTGWNYLAINGEDFEDILSLSDDGHGVEEPIRERIAELLGPLAGVPGVEHHAGVDFGYTNDPSEIVIAAVEETEKGIPILVSKVRIHCERLPYPIQAALLGEIDRLYGFGSIGLDAGGNGLSVYQELKTLDAFADLRGDGLIDRLRVYQFGENILVDRDEDTEEKILRNAKVFATDLWSKCMQRKGVVFPKEDEQLEDQIIGHTYTRTARTIVYRKGSDHILDAYRVLFLARESVTRLDRLKEAVEIEVPRVHSRSTEAFW
ncbi:hypothetical protein K8I61_17340 [bacterium]|nr:hypothetical protein [bacterium]